MNGPPRASQNKCCVTLIQKQRRNKLAASEILPKLAKRGHPEHRMSPDSTEYVGGHLRTCDFWYGVRQVGSRDDWPKDQVNAQYAICTGQLKQSKGEAC